MSERMKDLLQDARREISKMEFAHMDDMPSQFFEARRKLYDAFIRIGNHAWTIDARNAMHAGTDTRKD